MTTGSRQRVAHARGALARRQLAAAVLQTRAHERSIYMKFAVKCRFQSADVQIVRLLTCQSICNLAIESAICNLQSAISKSRKSPRLMAISEIRAIGAGCTYPETDASGIVHFTNFFKYIEEAEHALWRAVGLTDRRARSADRIAARRPRRSSSTAAQVRRRVRRHICGSRRKRRRRFDTPPSCERRRDAGRRITDDHLRPATAG